MGTLLVCREITKAQHHRVLFSSLSLSVQEGERIGLIGPNGAGKSTLLRILAGFEPPDSGERSIRRGARVELVAQSDGLRADATAEAILVESAAGLNLDFAAQQALAAAWLSRMDFPRPDALVGELSGGWRRRLAIARALLRDADLLLLDEPTNHLDLEGIEWLTEQLAAVRGAFVLVSHDRYLLEDVARRVIEISPSYPGGYYSVDNRYSVFLERRETYLEGQRGRQQVLTQKVRREIEWMTQGRKAQRVKDKARTDEAFRQIAELADLRQRNADRTADIAFDSGGRRSRKLLEARGLSHSRGGRPLFADLDVRLGPGDRVGLLGPNGCGKSTLINVLAGRIAPQAGSVALTEGVQVAVFDQQRERLDPERLLPDALAGPEGFVEFRGQRIHVSGWAQRFGFSTQQFRTRVGDLSGGEQARIQIARLMATPADVLLLDEPTNDLDIETLDVLEESLAQFPGALVLVTHDRWLLDRLCDSLLCLDGRGGAHWLSSLAQWERRRAQLAVAETEPKRAAAGAGATESAAPRPRSARPAKLTFKEQREWDGMEAALATAEERLAAARSAAEDPAVAADYVELQKRYAELAEAQLAVDTLYARWAELEAKRRAIAEGGG